MVHKVVLAVSLLTALLPNWIYEKNVIPFATVMVSQTKFYSAFSLAHVVVRNKLLWRELCSGGGGGGGITESKSDKYSRNRSEGLTCQIKDSVGDKFKEKEAAVLESLKSDIEKLIIQSGANVVRTGSVSPAGFYFEYSEADVQGRIEFVGERSMENHYYMGVNMVEKDKD
jgi:hypothetical protein